MNGKLDAWLLEKLIFRYTFWFFLSNFMFHFSLSCFDKNNDLLLKFAKALLSIIFKFSMISVQYLLLRADFYRFYDVICRHCEFTVVNLLGIYLSVVIC